jgi:colicin import membrane protein
MSSLAADPNTAPGLPPRPPALRPHARRHAPRPSTWPGFLAALAMHGALIGYLWFAVQWHTSASAPAVAVLWDLPAPMESPPAPPAVNDTPPPPPPKVEAPTPPKPDIVEKVEHKPKAEKPPEPKKEPPPKAKPNKPSPQELRRQQQQAEHQHDEEMARLTSQVGTPGRIPQVATSGILSNDYVARVKSAVLVNVHFAPPEGVDSSTVTSVTIELISATGELIGEPRIVHPSGLPGWDEAVLRAIRLTDPFPRREDGTAPRSLTLNFRPTDTR